MAHQAFIICHLILAAVIFCFNLPVTMYGILILYKDWNKLYVIKRHRILIVSETIANCIVQFVYIPFFCIELYINGNAKWMNFYGVAIILIPAVYANIIVISSRVWLLWYVYLCMCLCDIDIC